MKMVLSELAKDNSTTSAFIDSFFFVIAFSFGDNLLLMH